MIKPTLQPSLGVKSADGASVVVQRDVGGALGLRGCTFRLLLDGKAVSNLDYGQAVTIYPAPGRHVLTVKIPFVLCNSGDSEVAIDLRPGKQVVYRISASPIGQVTVQPSSF